MRGHDIAALHISHIPEWMLLAVLYSLRLISVIAVHVAQFVTHRPCRFPLTPALDQVRLHCAPDIASGGLRSFYQTSALFVEKV